MNHWCQCIIYTVYIEEMSIQQFSVSNTDDIANVTEWRIFKFGKDMYAIYVNIILKDKFISYLKHIFIFIICIYNHMIIVIVSDVILIQKYQILIIYKMFSYQLSYNYIKKISILIFKIFK